MDFTFEPLAEADLPRLHEWLNRPHLIEHWGPPPSLAAVRDKYLPRTTTSSSDRPYVAYLGDRPVGYVQSYVAVETADGWWTGQHDPTVLGVDLFLADPNDLDRGLGTAMVCQFVRFLFDTPSVSRIQVDPSPENGRAIRCYEKAGFKHEGPISTPDGAAVLMVIERDRSQA